jgi:hypothetical protein
MIHFATSHKLNRFIKHSFKITAIKLKEENIRKDDIVFNIYLDFVKKNDN